jgi:3-hydroxyanthranilate 3,4-dioxygenase
MIVAGPNARKDFHYNETEELFYQLEGSISHYARGWRAQCVEFMQVICTCILQVPHSPVRSEDSIGLVIERKGRTRLYGRFTMVL